jgi:tryptophanyl-tRNA synthetase
MSKSRNNFINIFLPEKELKKQILSIETDSKGLDDVKDPETCNVFKIYRLLADEIQQNDMRTKYLAGGYGYGHAKLALLELILSKFENHRKIYDDYMENPSKIDAALKVGAHKASIIANGVLQRVRGKLGYLTQDN